MGAFAAPILPGKLDAWEAWMVELTGPRKAELDDMNARYDLTGHRAWLQQTPDGHHMVVVVLDGPGGDTFMGTLAGSDNGFDAWFRGKVTEVHGVDFSGPPPPAPRQVL
jgi:hypothetical protein